METLGSFFLSLCRLFPCLLLKQIDCIETPHSLLHILKRALLKYAVLELGKEWQHLDL